MDPLLQQKQPPPKVLCWNRLAGFLDNYFKISARGSSPLGELRAGLTAFLAMSNNIVVNAHIMEYAGLPIEGTIVSSAFASGVSCILSGLLSNLPLGLVTSVGPNVLLAYGLVGHHVFSVEGALTVSFMSGLLLFILSMTPVLLFVLGLIPLSIKYGLVVGTGLLTAFIGLKSVGIIVAATGDHQSNIVSIGGLDNLDVRLAGVFLVLTASMLHRGVKGAVLLGMLGGSVTYWYCSGYWPRSYVKLEHLRFHPLSWPLLCSSDGWSHSFTLLLMLLFSISGGIIGCSRMADMLKADGTAPGQTAVYVSCGIGTMLAAVLGTSPVFVSMAAVAGIRDGGRTGLVSIVNGVLLLLTAFFLSPLAAAVPHCAIAPVLVLVGVSMSAETNHIQWSNMKEALPAFLCVIFQPFTYSVSNGIYVGVFMACALSITTGSFIEYLPPRILARWPLLQKICPKEDAAAELKLVFSETDLSDIVTPH